MKYGGRRQDFSAKISDKGYIEFWGRFPISGLGLSLALCRTFGAYLRMGEDDIRALPMIAAPILQEELSSSVW